MVKGHEITVRHPDFYSGSIIIKVLLFVCLFVSAVLGIKPKGLTHAR